MKRKDDQGQVIVIGMVLVLGLIVSFIIWFQVVQVPIINQNLESEKHDGVSSDIIDLKSDKNEILNREDTNESVFSISNTVNYNSFIQRDNSIGMINFSSVDDPYEFRNVEQSIESLPDEKDIFRYEPIYIEHSPNNFIYENGFVYEDQSDQQIIVSPQTMFNSNEENEVRLFTIQSGFDRLQMKNPNFILSEKNSVEETTVESNNDNNPIELDVKTFADESVWDEITSENDLVSVYDYSDENDINTVTIELESETEFVIKTGDVQIELNQ